MTDFLLLKEILNDGFRCYSLVEQKEKVILFRSEFDNFSYFQNKKRFSAVLLCNDFINCKVVGFVENLDRPILVNTKEYVELVKEFME